jgi:peptide/nickel transport system substrate-binding protein
MKRRDLLAAAAATLAAPRLGRAEDAAVLKFVPSVDLALLDPIQTPAAVTIMHSAMVFDTLYGVDEHYATQPQMAAGHTVEDNGRTWRIALREGLHFHDGSPVLARDAVASLQRWGKRDSFGLTLMGLTDELSAPDDRTVQFRLKQPFALLPDALGKIGANMAVIVPERLARTEPTQGMPEVIGSGPFRFVANERVPGSLNVYARFAGYVPRPSGTASMLAGPKVAHFDRVEWHTIPDAATVAAALQSGEMDWWDQATTDYLPTLRRHPAIAVEVQDVIGLMGMLRPNHLQPPFDSPGFRRAIMGAIDQADFMTAVAGTDRSMWKDRCGFFLPGTPMDSDAGMQALTAPRDLEAVKRAIAASGYRGDKLVLLAPTDIPSLNAMSEVAADMFRRLGVAVDYVSTDWGTTVQRLASREPTEKGGWSMYPNYVFGVSMLGPAANNYIRGNGASAMFGWPTSPRLEALRTAWLDAPDLAAQQRICRELQLQAFQDVPYYPTGVFYQATAYRRSLTGVLRGFPLFYNVRRA